MIEGYMPPMLWQPMLWQATAWLRRGKQKIQRRKPWITEVVEIMPSWCWFIRSGSMKTAIWWRTNGVYMKILLHGWKKMSFLQWPYRKCKVSAKNRRWIKSTHLPGIQVLLSTGVQLVWRSLCFRYRLYNYLQTNLNDYPYYPYHKLATTMTIHILHEPRKNPRLLLSITVYTLTDVSKTTIVVNICILKSFRFTKIKENWDSVKKYHI